MANNVASTVALVETAIQSTLAAFTESAALSEEQAQRAKNCALLLQQSFLLRLQNARLNVTGNFEARQRSVVNLSCLHSALADDAQLGALKTALSDAIFSALRDASSLGRTTRTDIETIVARNIDAAYRECFVDETAKQEGGRSGQGVRSGVGVIISGSTLNVGVCAKERIDDASRRCVSGTSIDDQRSGCADLVDCVNKEGSFLIDSGVGIPATRCGAPLFQMALDVAKSVAAGGSTPSHTNLQQLDTDAGGTAIKTDGQGLTTWQIIAIASLSLVLLAAIVIFIVFLVRKSRSAPVSQKNANVSRQTTLESLPGRFLSARSE